MILSVNLQFIVYTRKNWLCQNIDKIYICRLTRTHILFNYDRNNSKWKLRVKRIRTFGHFIKIYISSKIQKEKMYLQLSVERYT